MTAMMDLTTMSQREAPRRLRHGALRHLAEQLSGDGVLFFSLDDRASALHFGHVIAMGMPEFERRCEALAGKPLLEGAVGPGDVYDLHGAVGRRGDRLTPLAEEYQHPEQGLRSPWWRTIIEPFGYENHLRMPLYNNENLLVGVVIVLGKSKTLITEREHVRKLERETRDALLLADMFERPERPCEPLYALFTIEGALSMVSEETPRWLDRERRKLCAEHVHALLVEKTHRRTTAIDGMHLQFERLEGEDLSVLVIITAQRAHGGRG